MTLNDKFQLFEKLIKKWGEYKFARILLNRYNRKTFRFYITNLYTRRVFENLVNTLELNYNIQGINNITLIKYFESNTLERCVNCGDYFISCDFKNRRFCSVKCSNIFKNSKKIGIKRSNEFRDKIKDIVNSDEVRAKIKQTNLKKYGVEHGLQSPIIKNKIIQTKLKKYGAATFNNRENAVKTSIEKYGKDNYNNRIKAKQTCLKKYNLPYYNNSKEVIAKNTNKVIKYKNQFRRFIIDNQFDINRCSEQLNIKSPLTINKYKNQFGITEPNKSEKYKTQLKIYNSINLPSNDKILNAKNVISKELDIYIPSYQLAIEYNGLMYHSQGLSDYSVFNTPNFNINYHLNKTLECKLKNIQLFHIFEGENLDLWLSMIRNKLNLNFKIFARKCSISEVKSIELNDFLNDNHLQGFVYSSINLVLKYEDEIVTCMTFSKPRFSKNYDYELVRFCSKRNTSVVGGASKLFTYFLRKYKPKNIVSYANRRFSDGNLYKKLGFELLRETKPNYFYFKGNSLELRSRNKFQKHKLKNILPKYDPSLSEKDNMLINGYRRIYDCGNLVLEYKNPI